MNNAYIFGYGSLVNRATHDYATAYHATLCGWRRAWRYTTRREVAFLNAVPDADSTIKGLILGVTHGLPELNEREYAYTHTQVTSAVRHPLQDAIDITLYAIPQGQDQSARDHALLLSYIDVVVQGYLAEYGEAGVRDFFETTDGWDAPIINDRDAPRYPRHQGVDRTLTDMTDHWLDKLAAVVKQL